MAYVITLISVKDIAAFIEFETQAVEIMGRYGGKMVTAFEPDETISTDVEYSEVHCLVFPDLKSFKEYRKDSYFTGMSELREKAISKTKIIVSGKIKKYNN